MKKTASALFAAILLAAAGLMLSCKSQGGTGDFNNAGGKPYEIVVSIDQELWNGVSIRAPSKTSSCATATSSSYSSIRKRPNLRPSHDTTYMPGRRLSSP